MVVKYVDNKVSNDKFIKAGLAAEKQMGHYLERAFSQRDDIIVLNDLRIAQNNNFAQIDHLVIHEFGFIIIESKSVSSKISVNEHGEWKRIFNNREQGMSSPIQQAKRQADFLENFLQEKAIRAFKDNIINKFNKPKFSNYKFDVLVAISDSGIIERKNINLPEVLKADLIVDKVQKIIDNQKKDLKKSLVNPFLSVPYSFRIETIRKIANILLTLHHPASIVESKLNDKIIQEKPIFDQKKKIIPTLKDKNFYECSKCKSKNLEVNYGRNYYFKCLDCDNNIPIKHICNTPSCKPKTKKKKLQFFKVCEVCGIDELFWENKS